MVKIKSIFFITLISIFLINSVSAQIGIYTPTSKLSVEDIKATPIAGGGAELTFTVKNIGQEGVDFNAYSDCGSRNTGEIGISSGESKTATISLNGEGCNQIISCKLSVESFGTNIEKEFSFINNCSLCGTGFETCQKEQIFCSGNSIKKCDEFCRNANIVKSCSKGCIFLNGETTCKEDVKTNYTPIIIVIVLIAAISLIFILKRKR